MSTENATLDAFRAVENHTKQKREEALEGGARYRSYPTTDVEEIESRVRDPTICQDCGADVSKAFRRGFGDDGLVWGCPSCLSWSDIKRGAVKEGADSSQGGPL